MSSRAMAQKYANLSRGNRNSGGGILPLINALAGGSDIEGGLTTMPDGTVEYSEPKVKRPMLDRLAGGRGSAEAEELKRHILGLKYGNQLEQSNIKLRASEDRLTLQEKSKLESLLGKERAAQVIDEINTRGNVDKDVATHKGNVDVLTKSGIPYSDENKQVFDSLLTDPRIRALLAQSTAEGNTFSTPEGQDALRRGFIANALKPEVDNTKSLMTTTGPNQLTTMPVGEGFSSPNQFTKIQGPLESRTATEVGGREIPGYGYIPGKPVVETSYGGASITPGIPVGKININGNIPQGTNNAGVMQNTTAPDAGGLQTMPTTNNEDENFLNSLIELQKFNAAGNGANSFLKYLRHAGGKAY